MDGSRDGTHFLDYWGILVRRRWVVWLSVLAVTLIALVYTFTATPKYKATATLQIERHNPDILTFRDLANIDYSWVAYTDFYETQYKIISSSAVARMAVRRVSLASHPAFDPKANGGRPSLRSLLKSVIPRRGTKTEQSPEELAATYVLLGLEVVPVPNSHLVHISWVAANPDLAALVANGVADAYVQFNIESQYSTSDQAEEFLVNQISQLKREIHGIEETLIQYGEAKNIISIDDTSNITLRALEDIAQRRTVAQTKLAEVEAHYLAVREVSPDALPEVLNSDLIARLREEYAGYEAEFSEKSRQFKEDWPGMQTLRSKLEQARDRLEFETERIAGQVRAAAKVAYEESLGEVRSYETLVANHEKQAQRLKRDSVEYTNLHSEVAKKREALNTLIGRQNEMALSSRLKDVDSSTNIKIMERARPPAGPFRPRTGYNILAGLFLGLLTGVAMAFFLNYLDNTVNSPEELRQIVSLPILAIVPRHVSAAASSAPARPRGRKAQEAVGVPPVDTIAHAEGGARGSEAYRELRTAILLSNPGHPPRQLMITSANPEEGKTATATNLAIVLAQLGKPVLLVDTDLRRPRLQKVFGLSNERGVSTYLSGLEEDPISLVQPTHIDDLHLLPSGPIPPNPSELLNSPGFARLGTELLANGFAHIVFDSPPALSVSDPVIIASVVDSGILVVRAERTERQAVKHAAEKFEKSNVKHFGLVLNDVDFESIGSGYHYYHHYAGPGDSSTPDQRKRSRVRRTTA